MGERNDVILKKGTERERESERKEMEKRDIYIWEEERERERKWERKIFMYGEREREEVRKRDIYIRREREREERRETHAPWKRQFSSAFDGFRFKIWETRNSGEQWRTRRECK